MTTSRKIVSSTENQHSSSAPNPNYNPKSAIDGGVNNNNNINISVAVDNVGGSTSDSGGDFQRDLGSARIIVSQQQQGDVEDWPPPAEAPSLLGLCMAVLVENSDAITSLEGVPNELRHELTRLLCKAGEMNLHFLDLLLRGSPSEIRITDCSWLEDKHLTRRLKKTDTSNLTVLQLDRFGLYFKHFHFITTFAHSPSKFSALTTISLKHAYRLSDAKLIALVASTPALRSINLGHCSRLTPDGIVSLADKVRRVLKELYIDKCSGLDDNRIIPALMKLKHLEVLSMSGYKTVDDSFVIKFVAVQGQNMKELVLADCRELTDKAVKAIAENCPGLCRLDLSDLHELTDNALGHLANGCQRIQTLKGGSNRFSDEAVAAYVAVCGGPLRELSLDYVTKLGLHTALSLSKHAKDLQTLHLTWCHGLTDEAVGLIVDGCLSLKLLNLYGCTQITKNASSKLQACKKRWRPRCY